MDQCGNEKHVLGRAVAISNEPMSIQFQHTSAVVDNDETKGDD